MRATLLAMPLTALLVVTPQLLLAGCDDEATPAVTPDASSDSEGDVEEETHNTVTVSCDMDPTIVERPLQPDDAPNEGLSLAGRLVDSEGQPVSDVTVLACTGSLCLQGATVADGTYSFTTDVRTEKFKMQVTGFLQGFMNLNFYQDPSTTPTLGQDVVVFDRPNTAEPLPKETGGTVALAGGELVITAPAGIKYDIGEANELTAVKIPVAALPPLDFNPTTCSTSPSAAYLINPLKTKLNEGSFEVTAKIGATPGATYGIWVVDSNTAEVHKEATATADANGDVVKDTNTTLRHLDMIIFVPEN